MFKDGCIHPGIMQALSRCGHGDKILIADGNYPLQGRTGACERVYLGVRAGLPQVTDVLDALLQEINAEAAQVMQPADGSEPPIFAEFRERLPGLRLEMLDRYAFYDACCEPDVRLAISTGEQRVFANILLTVGVA
ncbi:MAG TPA: RbsD or FucU transport [Candidatus Onthenecus intestinigallinarum]|uniref:RbsD or FucU transport n=1 Tax=Candidatus Onthenecus intestinigallinarum TaxID=2840875 RepID=A0A9D0ZAJ7_9FIRM|nr:RbsD or FucU transport [Candidatus Onthenecus intestinigallinarum]